jgi:hypothetical protein
MLASLWIKRWISFLLIVGAEVGVFGETDGDVDLARKTVVPQHQSERLIEILLAKFVISAVKPARPQPVKALRFSIALGLREKSTIRIKQE